MIYVKSKNGETAESLVRRFKRNVLQAGLMNDIRRVSFYQTRSQKRRAKLKKSQSRAQHKLKLKEEHA